MKKIFVCSPLRGDYEANIKKAQEYCKFIIKEFHFAPFAPHALYTAFLDDSIPEERELGLNAGIAFLLSCDEVWVFGDTITEGMKLEINIADRYSIPVIYNIKAKEMK